MSHAFIVVLTQFFFVVFVAVAAVAVFHAAPLRHATFSRSDCRAARPTRWVARPPPSPDCPPTPLPNIDICGTNRDAGPLDPEKIKTRFTRRDGKCGAVGRPRPLGSGGRKETRSRWIVSQDRLGPVVHRRFSSVSFRPRLVCLHRVAGLVATRLARSNRPATVRRPAPLLLSPDAGENHLSLSLSGPLPRVLSPHGYEPAGQHQFVGSVSLSERPAGASPLGRAASASNKPVRGLKLNSNGGRRFDSGLEQRSCLCGNPGNVPRRS